MQCFNAKWEEGGGAGVNHHKFVSFGVDIYFGNYRERETDKPI